jgi:hypothetical protein
MSYLRTSAFVCIKCRKSFKRNCDTSEYVNELICPDCGQTAYNFGRNFHVPKMNDNEQWKKIQFLFDNGFSFQRVRDESGQNVAYPKTLAEAKEFVSKYKK